MNLAFFPVQLRFTPSHGNFRLAVCSPGDISPSWMVVFIPVSGRPFSVIRTLPSWSPEVISHTLSLVAHLDADGGRIMIPLSHTLVALKPARQTVLQAIMTVEEFRRRGARLPSLPDVRTFLRVLTGSSRINTAVAQRIPGLNWEPKNRLCSLNLVEEALDRLIASKG